LGVLPFALLAQSSFIIVGSLPTNFSLPLPYNCQTINPQYD
jgi:hypothetical protein